MTLPHGVYCAVVLVGVAVYFRKQHINGSIISIGLDFLQIFSIFTSLDFSWPPQLKSLFQAASASTFNTQVLAPECSISNWSFSVKCVHAPMRRGCIAVGYDHEVWFRVAVHVCPDGMRCKASRCSSWHPSWWCTSS